ncbi:MAG: ADP-ribosylglycohydrolase family protein [Pseudomonadota bacterium]
MNVTHFLNEFIIESFAKSMNTTKFTTYTFQRTQSKELREKFRGCLLAGAVGDALGAPVEFMKIEQIHKTFGPAGIVDYAKAFGRIGAITDDTQMTLFTAEGVLRAYVRHSTRGICDSTGVVARAYLRWLHTQKTEIAAPNEHINGWLVSNRELYSLRAPGNTCLEALYNIEAGGERCANNSKGCGGVMRVAPIGMLHASLAIRKPELKQMFLLDSFEMGCKSAGITHGHPTGQLSSGVFSAIIYLLLLGETLKESIHQAKKILRAQANHAETLKAIEHAVKLSIETVNHHDAIKQLGEGWIAEEALAISIFCALRASNIEDGIRMSVNHDGDSDSTGSIAGQILGSIYGESSIPSKWLIELELKTVIEEISDDLASAPDWKLYDGAEGDEQEYISERYPGN